MNIRFNRNTRTTRRGRFAHRFLLLCALVALTLGASAQTNPNARMLFKSGFEANVILNPVSGYNSQYQTFQGVDAVAGYSWPMTFFNPHPELTGILQVIGTGTPEPITNYIQNNLETVAGPRGTSTRALKLNIAKASPNTCCIQNSLQMASISTDVRDVYIKYWLKFGPEVVSQAQRGSAFWRTIFAMKTRNDYRIEAYVYGDASGRPFWFAQGDTNTGSGAYNDHFWSASNKSVPVPLDQWSLQEIYIHRSTGSDGRFYWAVNGQTVVDRYGSNYGVNNEQINALMFAIAYGSLYPQSQWVDDMEVWNAPPCTTLPCGSSGGSTAPVADTQAPTVPANLTATSASSSQIDLAWGGSTDNVGVTGYRIYRNGAATPVASVATTRYQDSGLAASTAYNYTVAAYDAAGNTSTKCSAASATTGGVATAPTTPTTPTTPTGTANLLRGKTPIASGMLFEAQRMTDGDLTANNMAGLAAGRQWIQFDLGANYALSGVKMWHYYGSADRVYNDVIVQTSTSGDFSSGVSTVFNNDSDNSSGLGVGTDAAYAETAAGKLISFAPRNARYVRLWSNGSNMNGWNHYTEAEAYGTLSASAPAANLVRGQSPTSSGALFSAQYIADGSTTVSQMGAAGFGPQWIRFDLGRTAAVTGVKVWHYYGSADRVYNDVIVQISNVADFSSGVTTVFNNDADSSSGQGAGTDAVYTETAAGKNITFAPVNGRYVRLWSNGSNMNQWNHYTEVEVWGQ